MARIASPVERATAGRIIWRWHFYAGMFCLPFIVILSLSGAVCLFEPQIDAFLHRNVDHLTLTGKPKTLDERVEAALAANPNARIKGVQLRDDSKDAPRMRPLRTSYEIDPQTFEQIRQQRFADKAVVDRVIDVGVAAHDGQLFGWPNRLLGLLTAAGYILAVTSGRAAESGISPLAAWAAERALCLLAFLGPARLSSKVENRYYIPMASKGVFVWRALFSCKVSPANASC
jgi:uncharacterized iron-regulated membrane protein